MTPTEENIAEVAEHRRATIEEHGGTVEQVVQRATYHALRVPHLVTTAQRAVEWAIHDLPGPDAADDPRLTESEVVLMGEILAERRRQDQMWGIQDWPWRNPRQFPLTVSAEIVRKTVELRSEAGVVDWAAILVEEVAEAVEETDPDRLRVELVQVAAVVMAAIESLDRNGR